MFEHIHLSDATQYQDSYNYMDNQKDKTLKEYSKKNIEALPSETQYRIHGTVQFLMPRPIPAEIKKSVHYLQSFSYMEMDQDYYTRRKNYASFMFLYTYSGCGIMKYRGQTFSLQAGDLIVIDCQLPHEYLTQTATWCHSDLHVSGSLIQCYYKSFIQETPYVYHIPQEIYQVHLENILRLQTGNHIDWIFHVSREIENLLLLLRDYVLNPKGKEIPETIHLLRTYIEHHYTENLSLDELATFCNLSKYHLCREYSRYTGFSPKAYIIKLRIEQAKLLLNTTALPSYKVGMLCGFQNEANFIRLFQSSTGITPGQWRKLYDA